MIKEHTYNCLGTCSSKVILSYDDNDDSIVDLKVIGGCNGNLKGISRLVKGMKLKDVYDRLIGTKCGFKNTSCPDQIALAIKEILDSKQE